MIIYFLFEIEKYSYKYLYPQPPKYWGWWTIIEIKVYKAQKVYMLKREGTRGTKREGKYPEVTKSSSLTIKRNKVTDTMVIYVKGGLC